MKCLDKTVTLVLIDTGKKLIVAKFIWFYIQHIHINNQWIWSLKAWISTRLLCNELNLLTITINYRAEVMYWKQKLIHIFESVKCLQTHNMLMCAMKNVMLTLSYISVYLWTNITKFKYVIRQVTVPCCHICHRCHCHCHTSHQWSRGHCLPVHCWTHHDNYPERNDKMFLNTTSKISEVDIM